MAGRKTAQGPVLVSDSDSVTASEGLVHLLQHRGDMPRHPATPGPAEPPATGRRRTVAAAPAGYTRLRPTRHVVFSELPRDKPDRDEPRAYR